MDPFLETVVVSYRCRDLVAGCLQSLRDHPPAQPMLVHVVDNDSRDGTVELVRERFPEVRLHPLDRNVGFARANNLVLRETSARYVLLLNPDAEVREGVLDHMLGLMEDQIGRAHV
jgi:GT2 family glycosyltransferase